MTDHSCEGHRSRCQFGRPHVWVTWFKDGKLVRTSDTYKCSTCDGICTASEPPPVDWDIAPGGLQAAAFPEQRSEPKQTGLF